MAGAAAEWQFSATYVSSFVSAAKSLGHFDAMLPRADDAARTMAQGPHVQSWWPGGTFVALLAALEAAGGPGTVRKAGIEASRQRMGPLVRPLAGVVLAMARSPVEALLSRLGNFVSAGVRGVEASFVKDGTASRGVVTFTFPEPVPAVVAELWYGMFDVGFTLARGGAVGRATVEPKAHGFTITW